MAKRSQKRRYSVWIIEGLIVVVALVLVARFLTSNDEQDTVAQLEATITAQASLLTGSTPQPESGSSGLEAFFGSNPAAKGDELLDAGSYSEAIAAFTEAIAKNDKDLDAWIGRGRAYRSLGNAAAAVADFTAAIDLKSDHADAYFRRGQAYIDLSQYNDAINDFANAIEFGYTPVSFAYYDWGRALFYKNQHQDAVDYFTLSLQEDPDCEHQCAFDYYMRGRAYYELNQYEDAIDDFSDAIAFDYPSISYPYYYRATVYFEQEQYDDAIDDYTRAINNDPDCDYNCDYAYNDRGVAKSRQGDTAGAVADYTRAIQANPRYLLAYKNRALANETLGRYGEAMADQYQVMLLWRQSASTMPMPDSGTLSATILDPGHQVEVTFTASALQHVTVQVETPSSALDPVVMLLGPGETALAYNDDRSDDNLDAYLEQVLLPEDGIYTLVIGGVDGESTGSFRLTVTLGRGGQSLD